MSRLYDDQAKTFDARAGLPNGAVESIVAALVEITQGMSASTWLEIGVGTGEIGARLARLPIRYLGLDSSLPMLQEFQKRIDLPASAILLQSDGNQSWPIKNRAVNIFFSSRALHHLEVNHVMNQLQRTGADTGWLLITGKVRRDNTSPKSMMKREMKRILNAAGYQGRGGEASNEPIYKACESWGAQIHDPRIGFRWKTLYAPIQSLQDWERKKGLDGLVLLESEKHSVLAELRNWAEDRFGDLNRIMDLEERYELKTIRVGRPG